MSVVHFTSVRFVTVKRCSSSNVGFPDIIGRREEGGLLREPALKSKARNIKYDNGPQTQGPVSHTFVAIFKVGGVESCKYITITAGEFVRLAAKTKKGTPEKNLNRKMALLTHIQGAQLQ